MEIPLNNNNTRTCVVTKKKTLKDGTVKEYKYTKTYNVKSDVIKCGKLELIKKISDCKDREKIEKIKKYLLEIGV